MISKPVSLVGSGDDPAVIDATGLSHGIFVDGLTNVGLRAVTISGLTVKNALFEGVLVVSASDVTIRDSRILDNDKSSGLSFTGAASGCPGQPGNGVYENDETGDCGGAVHFVGVSDSIVDGNLITGNADGLLISDETAESRNNVVTHNTVKNNPLECGIVLASHPAMGHTTAPYSAHFGVDQNTVSDNVSSGNGVQIGGSGVGLFSDGMGQGRVSGNVVVGNKLTGNGLGGVALHTHVGPNFHLPADDFSNNKILGNYIAGNLADTFDTATPGRVGININSGEGGSPVLGMVISGNVIRDEDVDVAINTPAVVSVHLNDLLGGKIGVANVCAYDFTTNGIPVSCPGSVNATENYWGCVRGPGDQGCTTVDGANVVSQPWLVSPVTGDDSHE